MLKCFNQGLFQDIRKLQILGNLVKSESIFLHNQAKMNCQKYKKVKILSLHCHWKEGLRGEQLRILYSAWRNL